jgi:hypothetical protein
VEFHRRALDYIRSAGEADPGGDLNWLKQYFLDLDGASIKLAADLDSGEYSDFETADFKYSEVFLDWSKVESISPERILIAAGICLEFERGFGSEGMGDRPSYLEPLQSWVESLRNGTYTRADLATMAAGLELMKEHRRRMVDHLRADLCHQEVGLIADVDVPSRTMIREPGWRHLKSRTLLVTGLLKEFGEAGRTLQSLELLPVWQREESSALETLGDGLPGNLHLTRMRYWAERFEVFGEDYIRIITALARCRAETGAFPSSLEALVPRYLTEVPVNVCNGGKPFSYEGGVLWGEFMGDRSSMMPPPGVD